MDCHVVEPRLFDLMWRRGGGGGGGGGGGLDRIIAESDNTDKRQKIQYNN